ncbi:MAG: pyridoxamine 5'-phosphate oxidase family protein [Bacteroidota bacterium]
MKDEKNLSGEKGIEKLQHLVNEIKVCLFRTNLMIDDGLFCTPMTSQQVDNEGCIWFFSGLDSDINLEIKQEKNVQLFFSHPGIGSYIVVNGDAEIIVSRSKVEELWSPLVKVWFHEGKDDPNISLIKVHTKEAHFWDSDDNRMVGFFKLVASAVTGVNYLDGNEGKVNL